MDKINDPSIFIHLGNVNIHSNLAESFKGDIKKWDDIHSIYDEYLIVLSQSKVYVFWPESERTCRISSEGYATRKSSLVNGYYENSRTTEYILNEIEFHLNLSHRYLEDKTDYPKLKIHLKTPSIQFHVSDYQVLLLIQYHKLLEEKLK